MAARRFCPRLRLMHERLQMRTRFGGGGAVLRSSGARGFKRHGQFGRRGEFFQRGTRLWRD